MLAGLWPYVVHASGSAYGSQLLLRTDQCLKAQRTGVDGRICLVIHGLPFGREQGQTSFECVLMVCKKQMALMSLSIAYLKNIYQAQKFRVKRHLATMVS